MSVSGLVAATDLLNGGDTHAVGAAGRLDLHLVPDAIELFVGTVLCETNRAAHRDDAARGLPLDQHVVLDDRLELLDPGLHHSLLVLGGVVLEVLGQVPQLARRLDLGDDRRALLGGELVVLLADGLEPLRGDVNVGHVSESRTWLRSSSSWTARPTRRNR